MNLTKMLMLVVDDDEINRTILSELFKEQFEIMQAANGADALKLIKKHKDELAIVLLDLIMPVTDGFEVLMEMQKDLIKKIPVILITGDYGDETLLRGYKMGVSDIVSKPFNIDIVHRRVINVVDLYSYKNHLELKLNQQRKKLEDQAQRIKQSHQFVIDALSTTVEFRSLESGEHIKRVRLLTKLLLEAASAYYPLTPEKIEAISNASAMHDIGKIAIPDKILLKPGRLTPKEFEIMKTHTVRGCEILESINYTQDKEFYTYCYEICRHHHEKWDGNGYPDGLRGDEISIWAQAASLADVYDALTSKRVYKDAYTHDKAVSMILNGECGAFNPKLKECFLRVKNDLRQLVLNNPDKKIDTDSI